MYIQIGISRRCGFFWRIFKQFLLKRTSQCNNVQSVSVPYRKPQGVPLMFPSLSASLEQSGYYRLEAYSDFITPLMTSSVSRQLSSYSAQWGWSRTFEFGTKHWILGLAPLHCLLPLAPNRLSSLWCWCPQIRNNFPIYRTERLESNSLAFCEMLLFAVSLRIRLEEWYHSLSVM